MKYQMMGCACNDASRAKQGMSYQISKLFSAIVPIVANFLPLRARLSMRKRRTGKTYHTGPTQVEQPKSTLRGHKGPTHPTAGQAHHWAAKTTTYQPKYWQQYNNGTRGRPETRQTTKTTRLTGTTCCRGQLQRPKAASQAHTDHHTTPDGPNTGGHDTGKPTPRTGQATVATQPPQRTGRPPKTLEQTEKTTKTTSGYSGAGCSTINPKTHRPTIRRLTQPGTDRTAAEKRLDNEQPANTQPARHATVETGTVSHRLATSCCATAAGGRTRKRTATPSFHHSTTDPPTKTTYFESPTPRPQ